MPHSFERYYLWKSHMHCQDFLCKSIYLPKRIYIYKIKVDKQIFLLAVCQYFGNCMCLLYKYWSCKSSKGNNSVINYKWCSLQHWYRTVLYNPASVLTLLFSVLPQCQSGYESKWAALRWMITSRWITTKISCGQLVSYLPFLDTTAWWDGY